MDLSINLRKPGAPLVNIDLQWNIKLTEPKGGLFAKMFRSSNRISKELRLNVVDIKVHPDLDCTASDLFAVVYEGRQYAQSELPLEINLSKMDTPFQLLFKAGSVRDCRTPQDARPRVCPVNFKVQLTDRKGREVDTLEECVNVIFEPLDVHPQFDVDLEEENIPYSSSLATEQVGLLAAWIDEPFSFVAQQLATVSVRLYRGDRQLPGLVTLGSPDADGKPSHTVNLTLRPGRANLVKLPLYIDFTTIPNPVQAEEDFTIEQTVVISPSYSPEVRRTEQYQTHFRLLKDMQGTELKIVAVDNGIEALCESGLDVPTFAFVPGTKLTKPIKLRLMNIATDKSNPRAGLYIKNLTVSEAIQGRARVVDSNNEFLHTFITMDGPQLQRLNSEQGLFIPNGPDAATTINLLFNPTRIADVYDAPTYDFQVRSIVSFDYWEDRDGTGVLDDEHRKQARFPVTWHLHLHPNPDWLCVDYGSSAIVCKYGSKIIDLKKQKEKIFRTAANGTYAADELESGTPFLSSDIVLHSVPVKQKSTLCSQQPEDAETPYLDLSVCLSPTSSLVKTDVRTQLPCLKILVGNEFLPDKPDYKTFQYARRDAKGQLATVQAESARRDNEDNCVLRISSIFNEAYAALFRYFIQPQSKGLSINKLVLTYPNTYTPTHLRVLEGIARNTFPKVREGYLRFVSESDAVAAYYLNNWSKFNPGRDIKEREIVLVYDMGAGTLDLTIFRKTCDSDGIIHVDILGKIGSGKAGNYLDYLLGEIMSDTKIGAVGHKMVVSTKSSPDVQVLGTRLDLKLAIKRDIKPNLRAGAQLSYAGKEFDGLDIMSDARFQTFLEEVTYGIIEKLIKYMGGDYEPITTVIMSGRSCKLELLRNALQMNIKRLHHNMTKDSARPKIRYMDFDRDGNQEKTVVVEGAEAQAGVFSQPDSPVRIRSRRLYASYGLVYRELGGKYRYVQLLHSSELPFSDTCDAVEDYMSKPVIIKGAQATDKLSLVQSYLSPQETQQAFNDGNFEFISVMEEYDIANFSSPASLNVQLCLDYKNNISLYANGMASVGSTPKGVDLASEITRKSIWPVTI